MTPAHGLRRERLVRIFTVILILAVCTLVILQVEDMLLSVILAFVINCLLAPFVNALERLGLSRTTAVGCIYLAVITVMGLGLWGLAPEIGRQAAAIQTEFPRYLKELHHLIGDLEKLPKTILAKTYKASTPADSPRILPALYNRLFQDLPGLMSSLLSAMLLAPLLAFFMLMDGRTAIKKLIAIVPNNLFETALHLQYQISAQISGFVRARLLESAIVGLIVLIGLLLVGQPYPFFLALFAGLTNLVPYVGPIIGAAPALLLGLINNSPGMDLLLVMAIYALAQVLDAALVVPLVVAKIVNLHAVIVIIVIIIGAQMGGILGMIISVPVASMIKLTGITIYRHLTGFRA